MGEAGGTQSAVTGRGFRFLDTTTKSAACRHLGQFIPAALMVVQDASP